jgi:hypothetical protein
VEEDVNDIDAVDLANELQSVSELFYALEAQVNAVRRERTKEKSILLITSRSKTKTLKGQLEKCLKDLVSTGLECCNHFALYLADGRHGVNSRPYS